MILIKEKKKERIYLNKLDCQQMSIEQLNEVWSVRQESDIFKRQD